MNSTTTSIPLPELLLVVGVAVAIVVGMVVMFVVLSQNKRDDERPH